MNVKPRESDDFHRGREMGHRDRDREVRQLHVALVSIILENGRFRKSSRRKKWAEHPLSRACEGARRFLPAEIFEDFPQLSESSETE